MQTPIRPLQTAVLARRLAWATSALLLAACAGDPTAPRVPAAARPSAAVAAESNELGPLARGLALALADSALRVQVLEDLRDSPFSDHAIEARSYLEGQRGGRLLAAAARAAGVSVGQLQQTLRSLPALELVFPFRLDRLQWTGGRGVVVAATLTSEAEIRQGAARRMTGYDPAGAPREIEFRSVPPFPVLAIRRAQRNFGADAESRRAAAPRQPRRTVSTVQEVYPLTHPGAAAPSGDAAGGLAATRQPSRSVASAATTQGYAIAGTDLASCNARTVSGADADVDEFDDVCEYRLAYAFRPFLAIQTNDSDPSREPHWMVAPCRGGFYWPTCGANEVAIFYALAYHRDGGDNYFGGAHNGDSEFIIAYVTYDAGRWKLSHVFMSAHFGEWTDESADVSWTGFQYIENLYETRTRPLVWVSRDKHANYYSQHACNTGAAYADDCSSPRYFPLDPQFTVEVRQADNLGQSNLNYEAPGCNPWSTDPYEVGLCSNYVKRELKNCTYSRQYTWLPYYECFFVNDDWSAVQVDVSGYQGRDFRGWLSSSGSKSSPYNRSFMAFRF